MRVLHTSPPMGPSYGGPFQSVRKLAQAEQAAGLAVEVRMPWSAEAEAHLGDWSPVKVTAEGKFQISPLGWSASYGKALVATDADIVHTHGLWLHPSWAALAWKKRYGKPHVVSVRGMLEPWAWQHHAWKKRPLWWMLEQRNLQSASLLHATSEQEAEGIRGRGLIAPIAVIPNGVTLPHDRGQRPDARKQTGNGVRTALFLSRVHPKKGLPMLLEAWARVRPRGWQLRIVGPDEVGHVAELKKQCLRSNLSEASVAMDNCPSEPLTSVLFSGPLTGEAKEEAFAESDLFILPTYSENFGIAVAEAMAHGLPVITTQGAPWKILEEERCGWWVPVSVDGIMNALEDGTRRSPEELSVMGARGRKVVEERFAWDGIASEMISCYNWLLGKGPKPECVR